MATRQSADLPFHHRHPARTERQEEYRRYSRLSTMEIIHYYRKTEPPHSLLPFIQEELKDRGFLQDDEESSAQQPIVQSVETESCFNVQLVVNKNGTAAALTTEERSRLEWLLAETFAPSALRLEQSSFSDGEADDNTCWTVEFGPRMTFTSAFSSNAVSICQACDLPIKRLEVSRRYRFRFAAASQMDDKIVKLLKSLLHDRMTEEEYPAPLTSFDSGAQTVATRTIPILARGRAALEEINREMGLGFDDFDLDYYTNLFKVRISS